MEVVETLPMRTEYAGAYMEVSSTRQMLHQLKKWESDTTAVWNYICAYYFNLNTPDGYLFSHEAYIDGRPADMVVSQIVPTETKLLRISFIVLEFKRQSNKGTTLWNTMMEQMALGLKGLLEAGKKTVPQVFGIVSAGTKCEFFKWDFDDNTHTPLRIEWAEKAMETCDLVDDWHTVDIAMSQIKDSHHEMLEWLDKLLDGF